MAKPSDNGESVVMSGYKTKLIVAAIDFGTTYSGYAHSLKDEYQMDQMKNLRRGMKIYDDQKEGMPAIDVFSAAIKYLKDHLLKRLKDRVGELRATDIHWVLTVPAIWHDGAKQFMKEAAKKFIRIGGTVDITVHEVQRDGTLTELHPPSGGPWGGTVVDKCIDEFLDELFGSETVKGQSGNLNHVENLLRKPELRNVKTLMMVGGFSESDIMKNAIKSAFPTRQVIVPTQAGLAVVKGTTVVPHKTKAEYTFCAPFFQTSKAAVEVYTSKSENPMYVSDEGCNRIGEISVELVGRPKENKQILDVVMVFGDTELHVVAKEHGGTIDITVHEVQKDGTLKELYTPSGGPWGGTSVDKGINEFLDELFGSEVMENFREQYKVDDLELLKTNRDKEGSMQRHQR
ncbi:heat shock 70 kDa protein 12B-like [Mercenaria mercenaria]|uniref:heat shock 70 kDa protein 12B-like n=1 Tax=Mercenaria mercenaria TaxID=6596 RepID=UPI00234F1707|nr:heat shock 70 kDa protein 12B-like [Mercenaria mercenaria]